MLLHVLQQCAVERFEGVRANFHFPFPRCSLEFRPIAAALAKLFSTHPVPRRVLKRYLIQPRLEQIQANPSASISNPLVEAVEVRSPPLVKCLLKLGMDPNEIQQSSGYASLHMLCKSLPTSPAQPSLWYSAPTPEEVRIFRHLIKYKANVNLKTRSSTNPDGGPESPLAITSRHKCALVTLLLGTNVDIRELHQLPLVYHAAASARDLWMIHTPSTDLSALQRTDDTLVLKLLAAGACWDCWPVASFTTPLMAACSKTRFDIVKALIKTALNLVVPVRAPSPLPSASGALDLAFRPCNR